MSQPRGFGLNGKSIYMNIANPKEVELNFIVDATNGNGLGVRSIKSNGYVRNVFMHTSASFVGTTHTGTAVIDSISDTSSLRVGDPIQTTDLPAGATIASITSSTAIVSSVVATTGHASATITYQGVGLDSYPNPNPASGLIWIQFKNNFNYVLSGSSSVVSPIGSPTTSTTSGLTAGLAYIITVLGTTTTAEWQSIGLPKGLTPTVGQSFIVPPGVTGTGGSHTGKVGLKLFSTIGAFETVGDPNASSNNASIAANGGAWVMLQCVANGSAALVAPVDGSVIALRFRFDGSSVAIPDGGPSNTSTSGGL